MNGASMKELVFLDPSFRLTDDQVSFCKAMIKVNDVEVINETFEAAPGWVSHKVLDFLHGDPLSKLRVAQVEGTTPVVTEMLAALIRLPIVKDGLEEFLLWGIGS